MAFVRDRLCLVQHYSELPRRDGLATAADQFYLHLAYIALALLVDADDGDYYLLQGGAAMHEAILFVEVKDPGNPMAQAEGLAKFHGELQDGTLSNTFAAKFIDTFLYRWAEERLHKPVHYVSLVTLEDNELLPNFSDEIAKKLPPMGKAVPRWKRQLAENCQVFNIELWNESFPKWPAARVAKA